VNSLVFVGWEWEPCSYNQPGCGQLPPNLPVVAYLTRFTIINNSDLTTLSFGWNSGNAPLPATPFTSSLAVVYIDSSTISNNSFFYPSQLQANNVASGVAISAWTLQTQWQGNTGRIKMNSTFFNQIVVSNSNITNNVADGNGGAIVLLSTSIKFISSNVEGNVADFSSTTNTTSTPFPFSTCSVSGYKYYGGGAIYATYYSQIEIVNSSSITSNQVIPPSTSDWDYQSAARFMSGGIFCCPGYNVTVVLDGTSKLENNVAPLVNDISCRNSSMHEKVPLCNFVGDAGVCEYGPSDSTPIILIVVGVAVVVAVAIVAGVIWHKRRRRHYELLE